MNRETEQNPAGPGSPTQSPGEWFNMITGPVQEHLAAMGWFIGTDDDARILSTIYRCIERGDDAGVDQWMCSFVETRIRPIQEVVAKKYPHRASIIGAAIDAHTTGRYELSVPVFLIQAEGIFVEGTGVELYSCDNGVPKSRAVFPKKNVKRLRLLSDMFSPYRAKTALNKGKKEIAAAPHYLNRHTVLHGKSTDYPTKINSLKAISCLNFVISSIPWVDAYQALPDTE